MNKYTIAYQYGTYSGTETIWADDEEQALALLWERLRPHMGLSMAYQSARIVDINPAD